MISLEEITKIAEEFSGEIQHENGNIYDVLGFTKVKINGGWVNVISYHDEEGNIYSRLPGDFGRFEVTIKR